MKFGKRLKKQIEETLASWKDKFLSYKELKQLVRLISNSSGNKAESDFVSLLNSEIDKFNSFFMEMEEDFIIRHKELQQRIEKVQKWWGPNGTQPCEVTYKEEQGKIRKDIVNFHGEMVLLINYSNINYIGLAKILKKYDKRTGGLLRLPYIQKVVEQPFFTTDVISKLVKELESTIDQMFPAEANGGIGHNRKREKQEEEEDQITLLHIRQNETAEQVGVGEGIFRNTVAALLTMQEIRKGSTTSSQNHNHLSESDRLVQSIHLNSPPVPIL
uniref:SPX domain-containing protein n=2 Tax=Opuntia streptacantha TaxID=393608 RepID=A0A7C9E730_OPUST